MWRSSEIALCATKRAASKRAARKRVSNCSEPVSNGQQSKPRRRAQIADVDFSTMTMLILQRKEGLACLDTRSEAGCAKLLRADLRSRQAQMCEHSHLICSVEHVTIAAGAHARLSPGDHSASDASSRTCFLSSSATRDPIQPLPPKIRALYSDIFATRSRSAEVLQSNCYRCAIARLFNAVLLSDKRA